MSTMNGGNGVLIIHGQGGGQSGAITPPGTGKTPTLQDIISGSERAVLNALIADFLKTNNISGGTIDPAQIAVAVANYLKQNPITAGLDAAAVTTMIQDQLNMIRQGHSDEEIALLIQDFINSNPSFNQAVAAYLAANPIKPGHTDAQINTLIAQYLVAHPITAGHTDAQITALVKAYVDANPATIPSADLESAVNKYFTANPPSGVSPSDIAAAVQTYLTNNPPTNGVTQAQMTAAITAMLSDDKFKSAVNALIDAKQTALLSATAFNDAVNALVAAGISGANINSKIAAYLTANPPPTGVSSSELQTALTNFLTATSFTTKVNALIAAGIAGIDFNTKIKAYLDANPISGASPADITKAVNDYLAANPPSTTPTFASWAELSAAKPTSEGVRAYLTSYNKGTAFAVLNDVGGGWFTGHLVGAKVGTEQKANTYMTPDGGFIAGNTSDKTYYWQRDIDLDDLNVCHFGGLADGDKSTNRTDNHDAIVAFFDFTKSSQTRTNFFPTADTCPIKFPAGTFYTTPVDLTAKGANSTAAQLKAARQKVIWRNNDNTADGNYLNGLGTGVGANGANVTKWQDIDVDYVKANKPEVYLEWSAQENHNGKEPVGFFGITGPQVFFGRSALTTIVSNKLDETYVFDVKATSTVIQGIEFNGGIAEGYNWTTGNGPAPVNGVIPTKPSNNQGFFHNWRVTGQYYNVSNVTMRKVGGRSFDIMDTIDCKFSQIYSGECWGEVICAGWSNAVEGSWDHGTAFELANTNFQQHLGPLILRMPRLGQSILTNIWAEHSSCIADFHDSAFSCDTLCFESSTRPVHAKRGRMQIKVLSVPTGVKVDFDTDPFLVFPAFADWKDPSKWQTNPNYYAPYNEPDGSVYPSWDKYYVYPRGTPVRNFLSSYETGHNRSEPYGTQISGSLEIGGLYGFNISNPNDTPMWCKVGTFAMFNAAGKDLMAQWEIELLGSRFIDSGNLDSKNVKLPKQLSGRNEEKSVLANAMPGKCVIQACHLKTANVSPADSAGQTNMHFYGDSCVLDMRTTGWHNPMELWVQLAPQTLRCGVTARAAASTRFESGAWSYVNFDGTLQSATPTGGGGAKGAAAKKWNVHNGKAGIGINDDGTLSVATIAPSKIPTSLTLADVSQWVVVNINGEAVAIPGIKIPT